MLMHNKGNSTMEYALVGVLLVGTLISGLILTNTNTRLSESIQDSLNANVGSNGSVLEIQALGTPVTQPHRTSQQALNGLGILPLSVESQDKTETTGGLGEQQISNASHTLSALAAELIAQGNQTELVQLITDLANSGHQIAENTNTLHTTLTDLNCYESTCDNNNTSSEQLNLLLNQEWTVSGQGSSEFQQNNDQLRAFLAQHPGILPSTTVQLIQEQTESVISTVQAMPTLCNDVCWNNAQQSYVITAEEMSPNIPHPSHTYFNSNNEQITTTYYSPESDPSHYNYKTASPHTTKTTLTVAGQPSKKTSLQKVSPVKKPTPSLNSPLT